VETQEQSPIFAEDETENLVNFDPSKLTLEEFTERLKLQGRWGIELEHRRQVKDKKRAVARMLDHLYAHILDFADVYKGHSDEHYQAMLCLLTVIEWLRDTWDTLRYQL